MPASLSGALRSEQLFSAIIARFPNDGTHARAQTEGGGDFINHI